MSRLPMFIAAAATVAVAACDTASQPNLVVFGVRTAAESTALLITPATAQINVGGLIQFMTNAPLNLQNQLQWSSSQPSIAATTPTGLVQGISPGTTTITVRYSFDTTSFATAVIKVNAVPGTGTGNP